MDGTVASDRRSLTQATTVGLASHLGYELLAGVGLPGSGAVGAAPAALAFAAATVATCRAAGRSGPEGDAALRLVNGLALGAVGAHLAGWPRRRTAIGLPALVECEGMGRDLMPGYNMLLYLPATTAAVGVLLENRSASRWPPLVLAAALVPLLARVQHRDLAGRRARARRRPDWWHRRLT